jgi:hypothetical protein
LSSRGSAAPSPTPRTPDIKDGKLTDNTFTLSRFSWL